MEIFRVLTHVLDEEQNHEFYDEYFSNVKINLSKTLFVGSLNDPDNIDPVLRDRLKLIQVKDLDVKTKIDIVRNYMLPELCKEVAMSVETIEVEDDIIRYIINNKVEKEEGCRQLKKKWETMVQKLNTQRITGTGAFAKDEVVTVKLREKMVDDLLLNSDTNADKIPYHLYN